MNVQYEQQGNYLIPCVKTKKQEETGLASEGKLAPLGLAGLCVVFRRQ